MNTFVKLYLALIILTCLAICGTGCTTSRPAPTYTHLVGEHGFSHDGRTRHSEPAPSHIR